MSLVRSLAGSMVKPLASAITGASGGEDTYAANGFSPDYVADFSAASADYFRVAGNDSDFETAFTSDSEGGGLATQVDSSGNLVWRAHNLVLNSATPATQSITVVSGADYTVEITGSGSVALTGAGSGTVTAGNPVEITASTTTLTLTVTGSPSTMWAYRSDLAGMADNPDPVATGLEKYVPTTTAARYLARRRHHRWDGSAYVPTCLHEPVGATNLDPNSDDLSAWTTSNTTIAKNQTGADGVANSAHSITATANSGTALEQITAASAAHAWGCLMKRITGTGTVEVTVDGGSTWVDITSDLSSSVFLQVSTGAGITVTNPEFGVRLGTSGDVVAVQVSQLEQTSGFISSPIITNGSTVARTADTLKGKAASLPYSSTANSMALNGRASSADFVGLFFLHWRQDGNNRLALATWSDSTVVALIAEAGNVEVAFSTAAPTNGVESPVGVAGRFVASSAVQEALNGVSTAEETATVPAMPPISDDDLVVFASGVNTSQVNGTIDTIRLWDEDVGTDGITEATS